MSTYQQIAVTLFIGLSSLSYLSNAQYCNGNISNDEYCIEEDYQTGRCSILQYKQDSFTQGVQWQHLQSLLELEGARGKKVRKAIRTWFGIDSYFDDEQSTETTEYLTPKIWDCDRLNALSIDLNRYSLSNPDLVCYSNSRQHRFAFKVQTNGRIRWDMSTQSDESPEYQSWGQKLAYIQASPDLTTENCSLQIRNASNDLQICLDSDSLSKRTFSANLTSLKIQDFKLHENKQVPLKCTASSKFISANVVKNALSIVSKKPSIPGFSTEDYDKLQNSSPPSDGTPIEPKNLGHVNDMIKDYLKFSPNNETGSQ